MEAVSLQLQPWALLCWGLQGLRNERLTPCQYTSAWQQREARGGG